MSVIFLCFDQNGRPSNLLIQISPKLVGEVLFNKHNPHFNYKYFQDNSGTFKGLCPVLLDDLEI